MPAPGVGIRPFTFKRREYLIPIYDRPDRRVLLLTGRQSEKCVLETEEVILADGSTKTLGDIDVGDRVVGLHGTRQTGVGRVSWKSQRLLKRCLRVRTRQGHELVVGEQHPFRTWESWTPAEKLKVGSRIAVLRAGGEFSRAPAPVSDALLAFTAFMIGEGGCTQHPTTFTQNPGPVYDAFVETCDALGITFNIPPASASHPTPSFQLHVESRPFLAQAGLTGCYSDEKRFPSWVWDLDRRQSVFFLNRLWSTDGSVKIQPGKPHIWNLVYGTISKGLAHDVQRLLWKFGLPSRIRVQTPKVYRGTDKRSYLVRIETQEGVRRFFHEIGALGKSEGAIPPEGYENNNRDTYPPELGAEIHALARAARLTSTGYRGQSFNAAGLRGKSKYPLTRRKLGILVDFMRTCPHLNQDRVEHVAAWLDTDLYWDRVVAIEDAGEQWCYDITVEGTDSFVVDGIVTHNSTTIGNFLLALAAILSDYKILFVSPSQQQTRTFSQDRLVQPLANSPRLRQYLGTISPDNVEEKSFTATRSSIRLRYAYMNAERSRGIPADLLCMDEMQDLFPEVVPILEQTLAHSTHPTHGGWVRMSGTPKSIDNTLSYYWDKSSQSELKIPCERHGLPSRPHTWYWVTVGETNIGRHSLICDKCGAPLNRFHSLRGWVDTVPGQRIQGYRVPQMLAPTLQDHEWDEKVIYPYETYPRAQFFNEILALPFESGTRPISKGELINCCDPAWTMARDQIAEALTWHASSEIFAGVDYTGGEHSWTVLALGSYHGGDKFRIFYLHRFSGLEAAPDMQALLLVEVFRRFNVRISFGDWGGGMHPNHVLMKTFGPRRHNVLEYVPRAKKKLYYNVPRNRWIGEKRDLVAAVFNALKDRKIVLPGWSAFETYGQDILNITIEHNATRNQSLYSHHPNKPDDSFHAILYCLLASTLLVPRPDIFHSIDPKEAYESVRARFDD